MFKNVAGQKITLLAIDTSTNAPKTGDAANITAYVSKDDGAVTVLGDTTATELDATNAPGLYSFDLTQAETNADKLLFSGKSSTANIKIIPVLLYTVPANFTATSIDSSGRLDVIKVNGANQTARDLGAQLDATISSRMASFTLPTNFSSLAITAGGEVTIGTNNDKTGYTLTVSPPTAAAIATAIWTDLLAGSDFSTVSSIGKLLKDDIDAAISSRGTGTALDATQVENAVWDANVASHTTTNTFGDDHQSIATIYNDVIAMYAASLPVSGNVADAGAGTTTFKTSLSDADGFWNDATLVFTSGSLIGQARVITSYVQANGRITFDEALTSAPANLDQFYIRSGHTHTKTQIAVAVRDVDNTTPAASSLGEVLNNVPTAAENADKLLGRAIAGGADGGRTVQQALAAQRNKVAFDVPTAGSFTVYDENDATTNTALSWTGTYTASAGANPVITVDPT